MKLLLSSGEKLREGKEPDKEVTIICFLDSPQFRNAKFNKKYSAREFPTLLYETAGHFGVEHVQPGAQQDRPEGLAAKGEDTSAMERITEEM